MRRPAVAIESLDIRFVAVDVSLAIRLMVQREDRPHDELQ